MRLALFDFDGTLTKRDTLMPFLRRIVGAPAFVAGIGRLTPQLLAYAVRVAANDVTKEAVLSHFLRGWHISKLREAGDVFARKHVPKLTRMEALERLRNHQARGDICVLVTASLDIYVEPWGRAQGFNAVLCSSLETAGDIVTGKLLGGNCYGPEKVRRIQRWLNGRQAERIWAYGDSRGDREMLEMANFAHYRGRIVKDN